MLEYSSPNTNNPERESFMAEIMEFSDLCSTCNYAVDCLQDGTKQRPVWFCEEFDCFTPAPTKVEKKAVSRKAQNQEVIGFKAKESARSAGLCMNCDNLKSCLFFDPGKNVLHCEEYH